MKFAGFEWDEGNWPKCGKHGVTKQEIEELFKEAVSVFPAPHRSNIEHRSIAIGKNRKGRTILVVFTMRLRASQMLLRPISARYVHEKERRHYEEEAARSEE